MDRGLWWATAHGVAKNQAQLKQLSTRTSLISRIARDSTVFIPLCLCAIFLSAKAWLMVLGFTIRLLRLIGSSWEEETDPWTWLWHLSVYLKCLWGCRESGPKPYRCNRHIFAKLNLPVSPSTAEVVPCWLPPAALASISCFLSSHHISLCRYTGLGGQGWMTADLGWLLMHDLEWFSPWMSGWVWCLFKESFKNRSYI